MCLITRKYGILKRRVHCYRLCQIHYPSLKQHLTQYPKLIAIIGVYTVAMESDYVYSVRMGDNDMCKPRMHTKISVNFMLPLQTFLFI